jgi:hypothetical protein
MVLLLFPSKFMELSGWHSGALTTPARCIDIDYLTQSNKLQEHFLLVMTAVGGLVDFIKASK